MESSATSPTIYSLGSDPQELDRLDWQAALLEASTRLLLSHAGIAAGMRVLDLGSGLGHVAGLVGELVGPAGSVVGLERSPNMLRLATERTQRDGASNVTFIEGDVMSWRADTLFDAIVGRLILFHIPQPTDLVRHQVNNLRAGGLFFAADYDIGSCRVEPRVALAEEVLGWIERAFAAAGAHPRVGLRLRQILDHGGCARTEMLGAQLYSQPNEWTAPAMLATVVRSLAPIIIANRIASADDMNVDSLEQRIAEALGRADAVMLLPTLVGAWGHAPGA
jgi:SAM-dependent methyltransferase